MLAGVLLHVVKAPRPVDAAIHVRTFGTAVDHVNDFIPFFADIQNIRIADLPRVVRLSSRRWVERGAVEDQAPNGPGNPGVHIRGKHFAMDDPRGELLLERIVVVQAARSHRAHSCPESLL